jgi:hypothetical protein
MPAQRMRVIQPAVWLGCKCAALSAADIESKTGLLQPQRDESGCTVHRATCLHTLPKCSEVRHTQTCGTTAQQHTVLRYHTRCSGMMLMPAVLMPAVLMLMPAVLMLMPAVLNIHSSPRCY